MFTYYILYFAFVKGLSPKNIKIIYNTAMPAIKYLSALPGKLQPTINQGEYVFCQVETLAALQNVTPLGSFQEAEGLSVILARQQADDLHLPYTLICGWITLNVNSDLAAVGLTAMISQALAEAGISCNVVAAFQHDHLFIPISASTQALKILQRLDTQIDKKGNANL